MFANMREKMKEVSVMIDRVMAMYLTLVPQLAICLLTLIYNIKVEEG